MEIQKKITIAFSFLFLATTSVCQAKFYNTTAGRVEGKLNVHLVAHSHDDAGWLRTFLQYYYGSQIYKNNNDQEMGGVQYTLDTAFAALLTNPNRKFTYSDMAFFLKWWEEQSDASKKVVAQLVTNGQLDFVNGGYVQHDEAAAHYVAMIDQTTVGHQFLNRSFGFTPTIGWQIDPFGHSGTQASLMTGALGFDAIYFARTDYQDRQLRSNTKDLELLWRGAKSYGSSADVFTGNFPFGDYNPPAGFMWEWGFEGEFKNREPIIDCDDCGEYNVQDRLNQFMDECDKRFNVSQGNDITGANDIMLTMGTDFTYANAFVWYKNIDKLIHYANKEGRINVFYSTPAAYTAAKHSYNQSWALKTDDFFPYADNPYSYWTGYFTTRPTSKGYVRTCTSFLQAARQLDVLGKAARAARSAVNTAQLVLRGAAGNPVSAPANGSFVAWPQPAEDATSSTEKLERAVALLQHHDAITGTAKQDVADDYHRRLAAGMAEAEGAFKEELALLASGEDTHRALKTASKWDLTNLHTAADPAQQLDHAGGRLGMCPFLNASVCHPTVEMSRLGHSILLAIYNPLGWPRTEGVRVPLDTGFTSNWTVTDGDGKEVLSQLVPVSNATLDLQNLMLQADILKNLTAAASYELAFRADAPPLGYSTYTISPAEAVDLTTRNPIAGALSSTVRRLSDNSVTQLDSEVMWYNSSDEKGPPPSNTNHEPSGAYIFRPNGAVAGTALVPVTIVEGPVLTEIRQEFYPWASLTTRIWSDTEHIESEWTAGPLPFQDQLGHEVVIRYESNVTNGDEFYTDSNGREMLKRKLNFRPSWKLDVQQPVAGNYYPVTAAIYIQEKAGRQLAVVTDRSQGGSSLKQGQVELMVHRRIFRDDRRGVAENLNETMCGCTNCNCPGLVARGTHYLTVQGSDTAASYRRTLQQRVNDPLVLTFGKAAAPTAGAAVGTTQGLLAAGAPVSFLADEAGLPKSVHLLTLKDNGDGRVLLRLAHLYQVDEDSGEAKVATVTLNKLFKDLTFDAAEEVTLAAGKPISKINRLQWKVGRSLSSDSSGVPAVNYARRTGLSCQNGCKDALNIELQPMEIRTFLLVPKPASSASSLN
ncbi:hypothetical protein WJX75_000663 [Coccomyxa subellipsoidea]|uniref:Alpha-mannosidase n=1 Tax=Coccomyxa subellipsoidea TaxID=248742 RepID=A0ABR2YEQ8_9CHLO